MPTIRQDIFPSYVGIAPADNPTDINDLRSAPPTEGIVHLNIARVIVTAEEIIIAQDGPTGPVVVFSEAIDPAGHFIAASPREMDSYVTTVSGQKVVFKKDTACGCGSRLRSWAPFGGYLSSTADPTE